MNRPWSHVLRAARLAVVGACIVAVSACGVPAHRPVDDAADTLTAFLADRDVVSGFTVTPTTLNATVGPRKQSVNLVPGQPSEGVTLDGVHGSNPVPVAEFPVGEAVDRARRLLDGCERPGSVAVSVLSPGLLGTWAACKGLETPYLLNDHPLPAIHDPLAVEGLTHLWSDLDAAALGREIRRIVIFPGGSATVDLAPPGGQVEGSLRREFAPPSAAWNPDPFPSDLTGTIDLGRVTPDAVAEAVRDFETTTGEEVIHLALTSEGDGRASLSFNLTYPDLTVLG